MITSDAWTSISCKKDRALFAYKAQAEEKAAKNAPGKQTLVFATNHSMLPAREDGRLIMAGHGCLLADLHG